VASAEQGLLALSPPPRATFDNFVVGGNQRLVAALRTLAASADGWLYLSGPAESGRTHLLWACARVAQDVGAVAQYLPLGDPSITPVDALSAVPTVDLLLLDDIDAIAGEREREEAVFHLLNRMRAGQGGLVVSAARPVTGLPLVLPDLRSRLAWDVQYQLQPPDDAALMEILRLRLQSRGLPDNLPLRRYLLRYAPRRAGLLLELLSAIERRAAAEKRRMSTRLAGEVLTEYGLR